MSVNNPRPLTRFLSKKRVLNKLVEASLTLTYMYTYSHVRWTNGGEARSICMCRHYIVRIPSELGYRKYEAAQIYALKRDAFL